MTDDPSERRNEQETVRRNRLAKALRDNLKRRKSQSRGRADAPADAAAADDRSRLTGPDDEA